MSSGLFFKLRARSQASPWCVFETRFFRWPFLLQWLNQSPFGHWKFWKVRAVISQLSNTKKSNKKITRFFNWSLGITPMNSKKVFHFRFNKKLFNRLSNKSWSLGCLENIFQKMKLSRRFSRSHRIEGVKIDCPIRKEP